MKLKLPRPGLGSDRILNALWENQGPMSAAELVHVACVNKHVLWSCAQEYGMRADSKGMYSLPQAYVDHFSNGRIALEPKVKFEGQIVPPRQANIWTREMTGYTEAMMRSRRA